MALFRLSYFLQRHDKRIYDVSGFLWNSPTTEMRFDTRTRADGKIFSTTFSSDDEQITYMNPNRLMKCKETNDE